jgi:hypothetical protein
VSSTLRPSERQQNNVERLREAILDSTYVSLGGRRTASPHEFYRYPARFSPAFARAAIELFTRPGDLILDPFVGGGTTLVESRLTGRISIGSDLNPLAILISKAKALPISHQDLNQVAEWTQRLPEVFSTRGRIGKDEWSDSSYLRNVDSAEFSGVKNGLARARSSLVTIDSPSAKRFARCILLRAGQWALDMREVTPSRIQFREKAIEMADAMVDAAHQYRRNVRIADRFSDANGTRRTSVLHQKLPGLADRISEFPRPKLILTSPPYPGVYVNYHRWKVLGRRETPAPFWLANELDGNGMSHYTMAAREKRRQNNGYFAQLESAFNDLSKIADSETVVVQLVGFHDRINELPLYLDAMDRAGFEEHVVPDLANGSLDGRLWREVPNRRWWVQDGDGNANRGREVLLVHRKSK